MQVCPVCGDEFEDHVRRCPDDGVPLVAEGSPLPPPPTSAVETVLGRFHPLAAEAVRARLQRQGIPHATRPVDGDTTEVLVPEDHRGDVRAELMFDWFDVVSTIPEEQRIEVTALGGMAPGWHDAPQGAWVDRAGRVQVSDDVDDERGERERSLGPALTLSGIVALVMAWYLGGDAAVPLAVGGVGLLGVGVFTPR